MRHTALAAVIVLAWHLAGCTSPTGELKTRFVRFDRAFIPALALTRQENRQPARQAMVRLVDQWRQFQQATTDSRFSDPQWQQSLDRLGYLIATANELAYRPDALAQAHEQLEQVRQLMMRMRARNGIDYYLDPMIRYHEVIETIVSAATGPADQPLSDQARQDIRQALPEAQRQWRRVRAQRFDAELFDFPPDRVATLRRLLAEEADALDRLARALQVGNDADIRQAALAIYPPYAKAYTLFGDFTGLNPGQFPASPK